MDAITNYNHNYEYGLSYNQLIDVDRALVLNEPVNLIEVKVFAAINLDYVFEDDLIESLITTAREMCETYVGLNFVKRQVEVVLNNGNGGAFLPYGPVDKLTVAVTDINEITVTDFELRGKNQVQILEPCYERMTVSYLGGYSTLPGVFKTAILEAVRFIYDNRGTDNIGDNAKLLLKPYRWI